MTTSLACSVSPRHLTSYEKVRHIFAIMRCTICLYAITIIIIIIPDLFYMDRPGSYIYWLKPELIEGLSTVGIVEF